MNRIGQAVVSVLFISLLAAGCQETKEFYLNPDGSGKIVLERVLPLNRAGPQGIPMYHLNFWPEVVWANCSSKVEGDKATLTGTVLFDDFSKVKRQVDSNWYGLQIRTNAKGNRVLRLAPDFPTTQPATQPGRPREVNEELVRQVVKLFRLNLAQFKESPDLVNRVIGSKVLFRFHLPGKVVAVSNMTVAKDGAVEVNLEGKKLKEALDKLVADDAALAAAARDDLLGSPTGFPLFHGLICKELFGANAPVEVEFEPGSKPLFDYKAEVAAAGEDWFVKAATGLGADSIGPIAGFVEVKSVTYNEKGISAQNPASAGPAPSWDLTLRILCRERIESLGAELYCVIDGKGKPLLSVPRTREVRGAKGELVISFPYQFYSDSLFDPRKDPDTVTLKIPVSATASLKELTGMASFTSLGPTTQVDLGEIELKPGAKGNAMGFTFGKVTRGEKSAEIECKFDKPYALKYIWVRDSSGKVLFSDVFLNPTKPQKEVKIWGLAMPGSQFPEKGKIVVVLADQARSVNLPFRLTDIKLPDKK